MKGYEEAWDRVQMQICILYAMFEVPSHPSYYRQLVKRREQRWGRKLWKMFCSSIPFTDYVSKAFFFFMGRGEQGLYKDFKKPQISSNAVGTVSHWLLALTHTLLPCLKTEGIKDGISMHQPVYSISSGRRFLLWLREIVPILKDGIERAAAHKSAARAKILTTTAWSMCCLLPSAAPMLMLLPQE